MIIGANASYNTGLKKMICFLVTCNTHGYAAIIFISEDNNLIISEMTNSTVWVPTFSASNGKIVVNNEATWDRSFYFLDIS